MSPQNIVILTKTLQEHTNDDPIQCPRHPDLRAYFHYSPGTGSTLRYRAYPCIFHDSGKKRFRLIPFSPLSGSANPHCGSRQLGAPHGKLRSYPPPWSHSRRKIWIFFYPDYDDDYRCHYRPAQCPCV